MLRSLSGTTRLILLLFALLLSIMFLLPKQSRDLMQSLGQPVAYVVSLPLEALTALDHSIRDVWQGYVALRGLHDENQQLRRELLSFRQENSELREAAASNARLAALLEFKQRTPHRTIAAQVIGHDASNLYRGVVLNKGEGDGVRVDMGVITPVGVVGRVIKTGPSSSVVLLVTDPHNAIAGIVQRSRDEGIIEGTPHGRARIKYLPLLSGVREGDVVVTSGLTGGFPRGVVVGTITSIHKEEGELFQSAEITPEADLSKLEEVLVITVPRSVDGGAEQKEKRP
ncbi:MAG TPA: rod shape-determining protein MreC [Nitrospiraceae bacterium]|nr:rod shape-determining protein MreC [Nitrospiraceae bacterium]